MQGGLPSHRYVTHLTEGYCHISSFICCMKTCSKLPATSLPLQSNLLANFSIVTQRIPLSRETTGPQSREKTGPQSRETTDPQSRETNSPQSRQTTGHHILQKNGPQSRQTTGPLTRVKNGL